MEASFLDNQYLIIICLILSVIRIYLEVVKFNFATLPITKSLPKDTQVKFHKVGFYLSLSYILMFLPEFILN
jgi:hypothetical protein